MRARVATANVDEFDPELATASDPLGADEAFPHLPAINAASDLNGLTAVLRGILPTENEIAAYSVAECVAAMRDLGMFLGSIKRHGTQPAHAVPEVVPVLRELGSRTAMVPRDTVHHYTTWNPPDHRRRMYVGDTQERTLQEAVRIVLPRLRLALDLADVLTTTEVWEPAFPVLLGELAEHTASMVESMDLVTRGVTPEFFARVLRPYFEDIAIDGEVLLGPAAAQVPLWLVDLVAWAADRSEPEYERFLLESRRYSLPKWRDYYDRWVSGTSMVTRLRLAYADPVRARDHADVLAESARGLIQLLRTITVFRGRHLKMAQRAYHVDLRLYATGSGGADVELLDQVLGLTRTASATVRHTFGGGAGRSQD